MVDKDKKDYSVKGECLGSEENFVDETQKFLDRNIRIVKNVGWILGGIGVIVILRRTYAFQCFTSHTHIPEEYIKNNVILAGRVQKIHSSGSVSIQHIPLLWRARLKWISQPCSSLLDINITGIELQDGGINYLVSSIRGSEVKFKLLGKDNCGNIESIIYRKRGWFRQACVNEDIIRSGFAVAKHVPLLSHVKAYNQLIERLVKLELKAVKKKTGIWKEDVDENGIFAEVWTWFKSKMFKT